MTRRRATHSNGWYTGKAQQLDRELFGWLDKVDDLHGPARAIISPHAGYTYCGSSAAFAFRNISPDLVDNIFILGPAHHIYLGDSCSLTTAEYFETPLYNLKINTDIIHNLKRTGNFSDLNIKDDEDEHSIEMQLPFIAKVMESRADNFQIIPILVGSLSMEKERMFGQLFAPYLSDPRNLFIISSDFCHWVNCQALTLILLHPGERFNYTYYNKDCGEIWQSISEIDRKGMDAIETLDPREFFSYLKAYRNTICGRHPIGVLLNSIDTLRSTEANHNPQKYTLRFTKYAQSNKCRAKSDSSVSYAAASLVIN